MKQRWARLAGLVVAVGMVGAAGGAVQAGQARPDGRAAAASHTVKVGIVYSRTGLLAAYGAEYIQGLKLGLS
jgi:branched-chain amino acid transport system substrate-binding protein